MLKPLKNATYPIGSKQKLILQRGAITICLFYLGKGEEYMIFSVPMDLILIGITPTTEGKFLNTEADSFSGNLTP